jgi:hypothetical protein
LLVIVLLAASGLTKDPNPNPVGFGILAGLTLWPSVGFIVGGFIQSRSRCRSLEEKSGSHAA